MLRFLYKYIYYFIAVALLVIAFLAYKIYANSQEDAWQFIPDNAFLVVESSSLQDAFDKKKNATVEQLADIPFFFDALEQLKSIQQSTDNQVLTEKLFDKKIITYSLHREAQRSLEYVIYIPLNAFSDAEFIKQLTNPDISKRRIFNHPFKGVKVNELFTANNQLLFNFFRHNDYLICSRSNILLEDVISKIKSGTPNLSKNPFTLGRKGLAHIYFKSKSLMNVADILPSQLSPNLFQYFKNISPTNPDIIIDNKSQGNTISGYVYSTVKSHVPYLSIFNDQVSKGLQSAKLIPQNTSICYYMGFDKPDLLKKSFTNYLRTNEQSVFADRDSVNKLLSVDIGNFYNILKNELVLCEMETSGGESSGKILLIKCNDSAETLNLMEEYVAKTEKYIFPKPKASNYLTYYIRQLHIEQLPALLFGSIFQGFPTCFYTFKNDYLVLASDEETMRNYLNNLQNGTTWGDSDLYRNFLKKLNPQAQSSIIINPQRIWNNIYFSLPPRWQRAVSKHEHRTKDLRFVAVENMVRAKLLGTKILLEKNNVTKKEALLNRFFLQDSLVVESPLITSPLVTTNSVSKVDEVIIQLSSNQVAMVSNTAKIISPFAVKGLLMDNIIPTDFFQNGQLQYLAGTSSNFYILTRDLEKGIVPFDPKVPLTGNLKTFAANENKVFVADSKGYIFVIDKLTQLVSKIKTAYPFTDIVSLQPIKIKGINYLAILQEDGSLSVIYETGGYLKGFPVVAVDGKPNQLLIEETLNTDNPLIFRTLSQQGEFVEINTKGIKINKKQWEREDKATIFELLFDQNHKNNDSRDWLIAQRSLSKLIIQDQNGNKLFDITNANPLKTKLKYLDLGSDIKLISVFDGFTNTIFDTRGNQLGNKSLPASALPALTYSDAYNKLFIYNPNKTHLEIWTLKIK